MYTLTQEGLGKTNSITTFDNCRIGITGFGTALYIRENKMTAMQTGVNTLGSPNRLIRIENNVINCSHYGIYSHFNAFAQVVKISNNTINLDAGTGTFGSAAIQIDENGVGPTNKNPVHIFENFIDVIHGFDGIALYRTTSSLVWGNTITLQDVTKNTNGVFANTCDFANISLNNVTGSTSSNSQRAFNTTSTTFSNLGKNVMDKTNQGLFFGGTNTETYMRCNDMHDHFRATFVAGGSMFGHKHLLAGNKWLGASTQEFEYTDANNYTFDYFTADDGSVEWPTNHTIGFFNDDIWVDCDASTNPPALSPVFNSFDYTVASSRISFPEYEDELNLVLKINLFYKCKLYPDSMPAESVIDSFYTANQNTNIGKFYAVNYAEKQLFSLDSANTQSLINNDSLINLYFIQLSIKDSLLNSGLSITDSLATIDTIAQLKNSILYIQESSGNLMTLMDSIHVYYSDSLHEINDAITTDLVMEENQKNINAIKYSTISKGIYEFDSAQTATILDVATQCPVSGGNAVVLAQELYHLIYDTVVFHNDTMCGYVSPRLSKKQIITIRSSFIYPNPASNEAMLKYKIVDEENLNCMIYNPLGCLQISMNLSSKKNEQKINCSDLNSGIYLYKITNGKEIIDFGKFSIIK